MKSNVTMTTIERTLPLIAVLTLLLASCASMGADAPPDNTPTPPATTAPTEEAGEVIVPTDEPESTTGEEDTMTLNETNWILTSINGEPIIEDAEVTMAFAEGRVNGKSACNTYMGEAQVDGSTITFGLLATTRMACPAPIMTLENIYLNTLQGAANYAIDGDQLTLTTAEGDTLTYTRG